MNSLLLITLILFYFGFLFALAYYADKYDPKWLKGPWIYALSMGVYCTAWTFYGSIGIAATSGLNFITIYLGPVIAAPLWISILTKIYRISKQQKISSIADFISIRYGGNKILGLIVTLVCLLAIVPYISLQLKAISETFEIITQTQKNVRLSFLSDTTFYIAVLLAIFAAFFGTASEDATQSRKGLMVSVAFESSLKLLLFLIIAIWITFFLQNGPLDIFQKMENKMPQFSQLYTINGLKGGVNWFFMIMLSFIAIFLLPRQFHVSVVELERQKYIKNAIWIFPLYLFLFNILVVYIAWSGILDLQSNVNPDYFSLLIPLHHNKIGLASLVFFGGFSAGISMVVVSTLALSIMLSNNVLIPYGFLKKMSDQNSQNNIKYIKRIRRISVFLIIIASYFFYLSFNTQLDLFSIGLIAFLIIAQLAPSFFAGLYWNRGSSRGANWGIVVGILVVAYTILIPFFQSFIFPHHTSGENGLKAGMMSFQPLLKIDFLDPIPNALYWSLLANSMVYFFISLAYKGNYRERNYAELFVNNAYYGNLQEEAFVWKGEAYVNDIKKVLEKFLGKPRAERALNLFHLKYNLPKDSLIADARLINFSEKLLAGSIGATSAKILISNVVKEQSISLVEVLKILDESKNAVHSNKQLQEQSKKLTQLTENLRGLNEELIEKDHQKDEFLDTVAHELKTPITSIKASAEILNEDLEEMPQEMRNKFLETIVYETDRITRLINNILDFEKLNSGRETFHFEKHSLYDTLQSSIDAILPMKLEKNIKIFNEIPPNLLWMYDEDKLLQVFQNLLSNSLKFVSDHTGEIRIKALQEGESLSIYFSDNGKGIMPEDHELIFNKFYQSKNQNTKKPKGSGLGLAICKSILENHGGSIDLDLKYKNGTQFIVKLYPI